MPRWIEQYGNKEENNRRKENIRGKKEDNRACKEVHDLLDYITMSL